MEKKPDPCLAGLGMLGKEHELSIGSRVDADGTLTYHVIENDRRTGVLVEKVYDSSRRLMQLECRSRGSRINNRYDPESGRIVKLQECTVLNDGNSLTREVLYGDFDRSSENIVVVSPSSEVVRRVQRQFVGKRTTFQGQTEYNSEGAPSTTVNHHLDEATGRLVRREQIQWLSEGQRRFSEFFSFDQAGGLKEYSRTLYHAAAGPFIEETQLFDPRTQTLIRRNISAFDRTGRRTRADVLVYNDEGEIDSNAHFFDKEGKEIAGLNPIP